MAQDTKSRFINQSKVHVCGGVKQNTCNEIEDEGTIKNDKTGMNMFASRACSLQ